LFFACLCLRLVGVGSTPRGASERWIFDAVLLSLELTEPKDASACETPVEDVGSRRSFISVDGRDSNLREPTWAARGLGSKGPERRVVELGQC
jgi:hypothetical protein